MLSLKQLTSASCSDTDCIGIFIGPESIRNVNVPELSNKLNNHETELMFEKVEFLFI